MPMRYANEDDVLDRLRLTDSSAEYDALVRLENGLCDVFDHKTGMAFGTSPVAETRTVAIATGGLEPPFGIPYPYTYGYAYTTPRLILSVPLRSVTGIEYGGTWDGSDWQDGETLATSDYILTNRTEHGYYGLDRIGGVWGGSVRITGIWGDQVLADVPADVREALTFLTVNEWHTRNASPAGQIGPDGMVITPRNPWTFELVKAAIDRHRVVQVTV